MIAIGAVFSKKNKDVSDFYLGGRKLGPLVSAMSAEASDMSSWLLMGLPGVAYLCGLAEAGWTAIGLAVGTYLNWLLCAKRLRHYTEITGSVTVPDFFENRFRDKSHILMAVSAIVIVIFFIPYTGSGFAACGKLFSSLFGIDYFLAMVISAIIIVTYTAAGGFLAASTTDFIQSVVMSVALICVVCFGVSCCGSTAVISDYSHSLDGYMSISPHTLKIHGYRRSQKDQAVTPHRNRMGIHRHVSSHRHRRHRKMHVTCGSTRRSGQFPG